MKKLLVIIISIFLILAMFVACNSTLKSNELVWVNYSGSAEFYFNALNRDKLDVNSIQHLAIFKFDSLKELEQFKTDFADDFSFNQTRDDVQSFEMATENINDDYFKSDSLFIVYVPSNSGSYRYKVQKVATDGEYFTVYVKQANNPQIVSDDMAGWFLMLTIPKTQIEKCTVFDAQMVE